MENAVYCLASTEPQADEILQHLRNLGFSASEISILLKDKDTRNISVKEDAFRGARKGGIAGVNPLEATSAGTPHNRRRLGSREESGRSPGERSR